MHAKLGVLVALLSACTATYGVGGSTTPPPPPPRRTSAPPPPPTAGPPPASYAAFAPDEDRHWFASDDYLISTQKDDGSMDVRVAKMITPASEATKDEARFLRFDGKEVWTKYYFRSRPAEARELAVGMKAFCHKPSTWRSSHNHAPQNKQDARTQEWSYSSVTDTSAMYKGKVSIGRYLCPVGAVRIVVE